MAAAGRAASAGGAGGAGRVPPAAGPLRLPRPSTFPAPTGSQGPGDKDNVDTPPWAAHTASPVTVPHSHARPEEGTGVSGGWKLGLIWVRVTRGCVFVKSHQTAHFGSTPFTVCKAYFKSTESKKNCCLKTQKIQEPEDSECLYPVKIVNV